MMRGEGTNHSVQACLLVYGHKQNAPLERSNAHRIIPPGIPPGSFVARYSLCTGDLTIVFFSLLPVPSKRAARR